VASGLQAALLLARGRSDGLRQLDTDLGAAARSFRAAWVALPAFVALQLIAWADGGVPALPGSALAFDLLTYVIGWVGFALLSREVAAALGREASWTRFIIVWNWCNVVQYALLLAAELPGLLGAPDWLAQAFWIVGLCWSLWLEWLAARLTLQVSSLVAAGLVGLDIAIGLLLAAVTPVT